MMKFGHHNSHYAHIAVLTGTEVTIKLSIYATFKVHIT